MNLVSKDHPALSAVASTVPDEELAEQASLIGDMWRAMSAGRGIGLAANQLGVTRRVIVIKAKSTRMAVINPVITSTRGQLKASYEGCLSFPGVKKRMMRYNTVVLEGVSTEGEPIKRKLKGLPAIVAQHEIDHLNGVTIND